MNKKRLKNFLAAGFLAFAGFFPAAEISAQTTFNVTTYGAVGDSATDNTTAIQNALNAANTAGGGTVLFPAASGTYLSNGLTFPGNNIDLELSAGATLQMEPMGTYEGGSSNPTNFITISNRKNVSITGSGTIDGQGQAWWTAFIANNAVVRPGTMVSFGNCTGVTMMGVRLQNAPFTNQQYGGDTNVLISGITVFEPYSSASNISPNTDGMDVTGTNINIENCNISDGDDVIAIGGSSAVASGITITGCTFGTGHGLSIGSHTSGGVSNLSVSNCTFNGTQYGIRFKAGRDRGGLVQNLSYSNLTMTNIVYYPFYFTSWYPDNLPPPSDTAAPVSATTPYWNNISFHNITASTASGAQGPGIFWSVPEAPVSNVLFDGVTITGPAGVAFDIHHAQGVTFNCNCRINGSTPPANVGAFDAVILYPACGLTSTPTPTATRTLTPTPSKTATSTETATATPTKTDSATPTPSWTRTSSPTWTATATSTKTMSSTATASPTSTATSTPSLTPTRTPTTTESPTTTLAFTATKTPTGTSTNSPTETGTATPTFSPTPTPTPPVVTFTFTSTPTATATFTQTGTLTRTPSATPTESPTFTLIFTATPSPTLTATSSATVTKTPTPTSTDSMTPSATASRTPTVTPIPTATASPTPTNPARATAMPSPIFTPTKTPQPAPSPTIPPASTPTEPSTATDTATLTVKSPTEVGPPIPYPNPATGPTVTIYFVLRDNSAWVHLELFTTAFREVKEVTLNNLPAGSQNIPLSLTDNEGDPLANGLYYLVVVTPGGRAVGKLLVTR